MIKASEFVVLQRNPDGFVLLAMLRWLHSVRPGPFAVSPKAMAEDELIDGWTYPRRYMHARNWLVQQGFLDRVHVGGAGPGDPNLYRLGVAGLASIAASGKGDGSYPNLRKHPAPLDRAPEVGPSVGFAGAPTEERLARGA